MKRQPDLIARQWLQKADHDFRAAVRLCEDDGSGDVPYDVVCFHAQQCVEKCIKAVLAQEQKAVPRTRDLVELVPLLPEQLRQSVSSDELALLNPYAVETRYPGFYEAISEGDARKAVEIAGRIRAVCVENLKLKSARLPWGTPSQLYLFSTRRITKHTRQRLARHADVTAFDLDTLPAAGT
mgnify:CR=1 FL=1